MAKATETRTSRTITLELSEKEAAFIFYVVGSCVTGSSKNGPREHSDAIYHALYPLDLSTIAVRAARTSGPSLNFGTYSPKAVAVGF